MQAGRPMAPTPHSPGPAFGKHIPSQLPAAFSPHCTPAQGSGQRRSRRAHSQCRWPASRCGVRSGRRSAPPRRAGSGTALWPPHSGSSPRHRSPPAQCPGSCRHTLPREEVAVWVSGTAGWCAPLSPPGSQDGHFYSHCPNACVVAGGLQRVTVASTLLLFSSLPLQKRPRSSWLLSA